MVICQLSLQRAVDAIISGGKADYDKSSIFILTSLAWRGEPLSLTLLHVGGRLHIGHLFYTQDAFANSPVWDKQRTHYFFFLV